MFDGVMGIVTKVRDVPEVSKNKISLENLDSRGYM